jgi:hypothetical protein
MAKFKKSEAAPIKRYSIIRAWMTGMICGIVALAVGYALEAEMLNSRWDFLFAPAVVGIVLTLLNLKPLSNLALILLPPVFALSGFALVAGPLAMAYLGFDKASLSDGLGILVETVPFFIIKSMLYRWYSSLASQKSVIIYLVFGVTTVVTSLLLFADKYEFWLVYGGYLGFIALLFSLLHLNRPLSRPQ